MESFRKLSSKGFTLIELIVVIAVLGVLAAVVILGLNPVEQIARARDAQRKTTLGQLARALQAYATSNNGTYPVAAGGAVPPTPTPVSVGLNTPTPIPPTPAPAPGTWLGTLQSAGEIKSAPAISGTTCTLNVQSGYCYGTGIIAGNSEAIVYVKLGSLSEKSKCADTDETYFLWSSVDNKTGVVCRTSDPTMPTSLPTGFTFL